MDVALALTVILNAVKDLLYVFDPETDNKQILRRCAPQNDIATSPQGDGRQAYNPNFRRSAKDTKDSEIDTFEFLNFVLFATFVVRMSGFDFLRPWRTWGLAVATGLW